MDEGGAWAAAAAAASWESRVELFFLPESFSFIMHEMPPQPPPLLRSSGDFSSLSDWNEATSGQDQQQPRNNKKKKKKKKKNDRDVS